MASNRNLGLVFLLWCFASVNMSRIHGLSAAGRVAVIGASGRLGREAVLILADRKIPCTLLLRKPVDPSVSVPSRIDDDAEVSKEEVMAYLSNLPNVERVVVGDVTSPETCRDLLTDCTACLALYGSVRRSKLSDIWNKDVADTDMSHAKQVNYGGVLNLIRAAKDSKTCRRIVRITGKGENPTSFFSILINMLGSMAKAWNYQGELALRENLQSKKDDDGNNVEYTIIRPGIMNEDGPKVPSVLDIADNGGDLSVAAIRYRDIAAVCCDCLKYPQTAQSTLTVMTKPSDDVSESVEKQLSTLLPNLKPDSRIFPTDMLHQHQKAVAKAVTTIFGGFGSLIVLIILRVILS